jgi:hypothetical protein
MSFLDDLSDGLKELKKTAESIGHAGAAPIGLGIDLAQWTFTDPHDGTALGFGDLAHDIARRGNQVLDPFTNNETFTGSSLSGAAHAMNVALDKGLMEPLSTGLIHNAHLVASGKVFDPSAYFDPDSWAKAYKIAQDQSSPGQAAEYLGYTAGAALFGHGADLDPFARAGKKNPYQTVDALNSSPFARTAAGVGDFALMWEADPAVLAGKAAGLAHTKVFLKQLGSFDKAGFLARISPELTDIGEHAAGLTHRVDKFFDFIAGENKYQRPLSGPEVFAASPELRRSTNGKTIAQMFSDAAHLEDPAEARQAYKLALAVTVGDRGAIDALGRQTAATQHLADTFGNMLRGGPLDLETQALNEWARFNPTMFAEYQRQLTNQDHAGDLSKFVRDWSDRVEKQLAGQTRLAQNARNLDYVPGVHDATPLSDARAGLKRVNEDRLVDKGAAAHEKLNAAVERLAREPKHSVWQQGLAQVPLVVVKATNPITGLYTGRAAKNVLGALRTQHYTGRVELHDWNNAVDQLDSMLKLAKVPTDLRLRAVADASRAVTEPEKLRSIEASVRTAMHGLSDHWGDTFGGQKIDKPFLDEVVRKFGAKTDASLAASQGSQYAATRLPADMLARPEYDFRVNRAHQDSADDVLPHDLWRVDQIDEDGILYSLPLLESQLGNTKLLPDFANIDKALSRAATHQRLVDWGDAWSKQNRTLEELQARRASALERNAKGPLRMIDASILGVRKGMDAALDAAGMLVRGWKWSVLARLGYPMRVVSDDQLRIANKVAWVREMFLPNMAEAGKNFAYNNTPAWARNGRNAEALANLRQAEFARGQLADAYHLESRHTPAALKEIRDAVGKLGGKATDEEKSAAEAVLARLDPDRVVAQTYQRKAAISKLASRASGKRAAITRWRSQMELHPHRAVQLSKKIRAAEEQIAAHDAERSFLMSQLPELDPMDARKELDALDELIEQGRKGPAFRPEKRSIGQKDVPIKGLGPDLHVSGPKDYFLAEGAYGNGGKTLKEVVGSDDAFQKLAYGPETAYSGHMRAGAYQTVTPESPGHLGAWADVLNHQVRNDRLAMRIVKNPDATVEELADWIRAPEQADLRARVPHYAHDAEDWAGRVRALVNDYVPSDALREAVRKGDVSAAKLERMFPVPELRPAVHGQAVDFNTGRSAAAKMIGGVYDKTFKVLGELPTDRLSRHPFFNTMYKKHLQDVADSDIAYAKATGKTQFTEEDVRDWERAARRKALNDLRSTLWDVSAHKHAGHVMRFLSPFFVAHTEALSRWWRIVQDDPSVVRKFQMVFDAPRRAGLVYDTRTGEPVKPGEAVTSNHRIILRFPGANNSAVNKWLRKMGGGKYFSISENGLNIILQNGIANPGTGPMVTVPVQAIAKEYANDPSIAKFAQMVAPYPQESVVSGLAPASWKRWWALYQAKHGNTSNTMYAQAFGDNATDLLIDFKKKNDREPNSAEFNALMKRAGREAQHDLFLEALSSSFGYTPARPEGKYAAIQRGYQRIQEQAATQGEDFDWVKDQFKAKYGDIYTPLLYSTSINPAMLRGTPGEVSAVKKYRNLVGSLDNPRLARLVVGPTAAMLADSAKANGDYSAEARMWLRQQHVTSDGKALLDTKTPKDAALGGIIQDGWDQYDTMMTQLTAAAEQLGVPVSDPRVMALKKSEVARIGAGNEYWMNDYNDRSAGSGKYDKVLVDLRKIASYKGLTQDTERQDVQMLRNYLEVRDAVGQVLQQSAAAGGSASPTAKSNAELMQRFHAIVDQMALDNTYFGTYDFGGTIEFDPYYTAGGVK